jgi:hypothetical protein
VNGPLYNWTLAEVKIYCASIKECCDCPFFNMKCGLQNVPPNNWQFSGSYGFTEREAKDAKSIIRIMGLSQKAVIHRYEAGFILVVDGKRRIQIENSLFPSVKNDETVNLIEIAKYASED